MTCGQDGNEYDALTNRTEGRGVYRTRDGEYRAVDTQNTAIAHTDSKGRHAGEFNIDVMRRKPADRSGRHDLRCG